MFGMWYVLDVGCLECWGYVMMGIWDVGCGMFAGIRDFDLQNASHQQTSC